MKRVVTTACMAFALTLGWACVGGESTRNAFAATPDGDPEAMRIHVENNNWLQVAVKVVSGGMPRRLGTVETTGDRTFTIPTTVSPMGVRFLIDPLGSGQTFLTPIVTPHHGMVVNLRIENNLNLTSMTVR